MVRLQMRPISSGRKRRTGGGPPCRCTWLQNTFSPGSSTLDRACHDPGVRTSAAGTRPLPAATVNGRRSPTPRPGEASHPVAALCGRCPDDCPRGPGHPDVGNGLTRDLFGRWSWSVVEPAQDLVESALALEADAGDLGESDSAVADHGLVGEAAGRLELTGVGLVAAELQGCGDVQGELMASVWDAATRGPAMRPQHLLDP